MEFIALYHKGKTVGTTVGSVLNDRTVSQLQAITGGEEKFIPAGYAHRPDLIANLFFGGPQGWWEVMSVNGLSDPFESLNVGDRVSLPNA
jgi:hypothetical protein